MIFVDRGEGLGGGKNEGREGGGLLCWGKVTEHIILQIIFESRFEGWKEMNKQIEEVVL